jgi:hypothetical protein
VIERPCLVGSASEQFNDFVVNELIDSSSSDDEDKLNETIHHRSIVGHRIVDREMLLRRCLLYPFPNI